MDDRDDESLLGLHRDADVVAVEIDDRAVLDAGVQLRELLQRLGDRLERERDDPLQVDAGEVAFLDPGDGRNLVRAGEVLEHLALDPANRLAALGLTGSDPADVLFGDAPLRAGAAERRKVDAELFREPAHERRCPNLPLF